MPKFAGKTAIVLDVSGSMRSTISPKSVISLKEWVLVMGLRFG